MLYLKLSVKNLTHFIQAAPGKVSITADTWTADAMKVGFLGLTAHWIEVKEKKWVLKSAVIGLKGIVGTHKGDNLGRYIVGLCDRVGIMSKTHSKVREISKQDHMSVVR